MKAKTWYIFDNLIYHNYTKLIGYDITLLKQSGRFYQDMRFRLAMFDSKTKSKSDIRCNYSRSIISTNRYIYLNDNEIRGYLKQFKNIHYYE